ncbi:conserved oligomeric Golgi complex subunit 5 [bacterium]|nr:conserved oligomeric Golgi complex subunit 5 [bacterium]
MQAEDFFRVISEVEFICEDIDELKEQVDLTKSENHKISEAITNIENARKILTELFPNIKSLNSDIREDLAAEYADI